jgi:hypothetical protein
LQACRGQQVSKLSG